MKKLSRKQQTEALSHPSKLPNKAAEDNWDLSLVDISVFPRPGRWAREPRSIPGPIIPFVEGWTGNRGRMFIARGGFHTYDLISMRSTFFIC